MTVTLETAACQCLPIRQEWFNPKAQLPHGLTTEHLARAMTEFTEFLSFINTQLQTRNIQRIETMLMAANFSSIVGEFMVSAIPRHCPTLAKNRYHNGHPDLVPAGMFTNNAVQHAGVGIEVKASRYMRGWQGHNPEDTWLMVFMFDCNGPTDATSNLNPKPFSFVRVVGAQLEKTDWTYAGRSETSRRTITASVNNSGYAKMISNWIYNKDS